MPLARIITKLTEESQQLQEELRARGFEVETASPDQLQAEPADLEITLEEMTPAQALAQADAISDAENLPVYITPGSISENSRPMTVVPIVPQPELLPSVVENHAAQDSQGEEEDRQFDPVAFERERYWVRTSPDEAPEYADAPPETGHSSVPFEQPVVDLVQETLYTQTIEQASPATVTEASASDESVALPPEVQEMLPELEAVMPDMEAWAREEGPVSDWPIWQAGALDPTELIQAIPVIQLPQPAPLPEMQTVRKMRRNPFPSDRVFWKTAAWASMVALSALVLGATVHRFSPVPARFANTAQAPDPKPVPTNTPAATPVAIKPGATLKRTSAHEERVTRTESSHPVAAAKPQARKHSSSADSLVAEDTVVRYKAKPPAPKVQAQMKSDGIKRYTDLK